MSFRLGREAVTKRISEMLALRDEFVTDIKNGNLHHVKLQGGNSKTGRNCWTVSLIPIVDCVNCEQCMYDCYDIKNVCRFKTIKKDRAKNSAIHMLSPERFWAEVEECVRANAVTQLRINVGGDLRLRDFELINEIAKRTPFCTYLFFTKNINDLNLYLDNCIFEDNIRCILSRWIGVDVDNKHNVPEAHVLYPDGTTTAPEFGSKYCRGNCTECYVFQDGCYSLGKGESVIFVYH